MSNLQVLTPLSQLRVQVNVPKPPDFARKSRFFVDAFIYLVGEMSTYELRNRIFSKFPVFRKKSEVIDLVKRLNIPVIDIHQEVFFNHPNLLSLFPLRLSGHYNKEAYRLVAKAIINSID